MHWFRKAAQAGDATAMYNIGWMFEHGLGVLQDYEKAMEWYRKAALAGDTEAIQKLFELGREEE